MRQCRRLARIGCCRTVCLWRWNGEQLACSGDVVRTGAIGEQAVVTNAVEAAGQHVNEEPADELVVCETWISLEPGWRVFDGPHATIAVEYVPPRVQ